MLMSHYINSDKLKGLLLTDRLILSRFLFPSVFLVSTVISVCFLAFTCNFPFTEIALTFDTCVTAGGWWEITKFDDINGPISVEMGSMRYVEAMDNGLFKLGSSHDLGQCRGHFNLHNLLQILIFLAVSFFTYFTGFRMFLFRNRPNDSFLLWTWDHTFNQVSKSENEEPLYFKLQS